MNNPEYSSYSSKQLQAALESAYENMLAFKRYKQTPVVVVRNGQVVEVSPDEIAAVRQKAA